MLSLINPPFASHESTDSPERPLSSPQRSASTGGYLPSPKFITSASIRQSPFPSPLASDSRSAFSPRPGMMGGAFTPYKGPISKQHKKSPVIIQVENEHYSTLMCLIKSGLLLVYLAISDPILVCYIHVSVHVYLISNSLMHRDTCL